MSMSVALWSKETNECVEVAIVGKAPLQRMQANVLAGFLAYHTARSLDTPGANALVLMDMDSPALDDATVWSEESWKNLLSRDPEAGRLQREFEDAPSGGFWQLCAREAANRL